MTDIRLTTCRNKLIPALGDERIVLALVRFEGAQTCAGGLCGQGRLAVTPDLSYPGEVLWRALRSVRRVGMDGQPFAVQITQS
jgi:hypothetical protein